MKFLILRFSSFGDVTQCLSVPSQIHNKYPEAKIHWAVRDDLAELLEGHPHIERKWPLSRGTGLRGLIKLGLDLRRQSFSHLYDAHNNLRSHLLSWILRFPRRGKSLVFLRKSQKRWKRILLFWGHRNTYEMPLSGQRDLLEPLQAWGVAKTLPPTPQLFLSPVHQKNLLGKIPWPAGEWISLAPSSAFALKRWPVEYWRELISLFPSKRFLLLGGPEDSFLAELALPFSDRVINLAGRCSLMESAAAIQLGQALVANDTGLLHVAEQLGKPAIALMGPAPFGFPSRPLTRILQLDLPCRPCSKHGQGPCTNPEFQLCLRGISVNLVASQLNELIKGARDGALQGN